MFSSKNRAGILLIFQHKCQEQLRLIEGLTETTSLYLLSPDPYLVIYKATGAFVVPMLFGTQVKGLNWGPNLQFPGQTPANSEPLKSLKSSVIVKNLMQTCRISLC